MPMATVSIRDCVNLSFVNEGVDEIKEGNVNNLPNLKSRAGLTLL